MNNTEHDFENDEEVEELSTQEPETEEEVEETFDEEEVEELVTQDHEQNTDVEEITLMGGETLSVVSPDTQDLFSKVKKAFEGHKNAVQHLTKWNPRYNPDININIIRQFRKTSDEFIPLCEQLLITLETELEEENS